MDKRAVIISYCLLSFSMGATAMLPMSDADLRAADVVSDSINIDMAGSPAFVKMVLLPFCKHWQRKRDRYPDKPCIDPASGEVLGFTKPDIRDLAAQLPAVQRATAWKLGDEQIMYIDFNLNHADLFVNFGDDGEVLMFDDVTLHKDGKPTKIGPLSNRISAGERVDGQAVLTMFSEAKLDMSLDIGAIRVAKNLEVGPDATSLGGLSLDNMLITISNQISMHRN